MNKETIVRLLLEMKCLSVKKLCIFKLTGHLITDAIQFIMKSMKSYRSLLNNSQRNKWNLMWPFPP